MWRWCFAAGLLALGCLPAIAGSAGSGRAAPAAQRVTVPQPIPLESNPITDAKRIARLRREGKLPDSFTQGRCRYDLAGDPGAAYYVKTCR